MMPILAVARSACWQPIRRCITVLALVASCVSNAEASPFTPSRGDEVLERVPIRTSPEQRELERARAAVAASPGNLQASIRLAKRYIETWRNDGDPRYLGYAQAALAPWWSRKDPPAEARVLRATLSQSTHRFPEALADLDAVLAQDARNAQAWLTKATVLQVLGDYPQASASCRRLVGLAPNLVVITCLSAVRSLNGQAEAGYRQLDGALKTAGSEIDPSIRTWSLTLLAEMAARRGDDAAARRHFEKAISLGKPDNYLLAAYSDFLLDAKEAEKVVSLLATRTQVDVLLLRYAIALRALASADAPRYTALLAERLEAVRMRGDAIHGREQARFALDLHHDPIAALEYARQNWKVQKEPADARLLLEAAVAANDEAAARPVIDWIRQAGLEDRTLAPLVAKLEGSVK
jgi:tetratricopeptide (TPR) repeat protein